MFLLDFVAKMIVLFHSDAPKAIQRKKKKKLAEIIAEKEAAAEAEKEAKMKVRPKPQKNINIIFTVCMPMRDCLENFRKHKNFCASDFFFFFIYCVCIYYCILMINSGC